MIVSWYCVCFGYTDCYSFQFCCFIINKKKQIFVLSKLISSRNMMII